MFIYLVMIRIRILINLVVHHHLHLIVKDIYVQQLVLLNHYILLKMNIVYLMLKYKTLFISDSDKHKYINLNQISIEENIIRQIC